MSAYSNSFGWPSPPAAVKLDAEEVHLWRASLDCDGSVLSRLESAHLVEAVIEEVSDAILRGENVKLSSFGTFMQRSKRERIGRNPKTGVEATISPRKVLIFKASHIMRDRINNDQVNED